MAETILDKYEILYIKLEKNEGSYKTSDLFDLTYNSLLVSLKF